MVSADFVATCVALARDHSQGSTVSTDSHLSALSLYDDSVSNPPPSSSPYDVSEAEAVFYYSGLHSSPRLVYRTGSTPWVKPTGPEAYRQLKELRPVFGHKLNIVWEDLGPQIWQLLDYHGVLWTSIDVVRFLKVGDGETVGPVVLWIGVFPETLSGEDARTSANNCLDLLKKFDITDVEVEYRESIYTRSVGPSLLKPVSSGDLTVDVRGPLTPALGISIAAKATPHIGGTGGLYLAEGGDSKKLLLLTARHVLLPSDRPNINYVYTNTSAPRRQVLLLSTNGFTNLVKSIMVSVGIHSMMVGEYERDIKQLKESQTGENDEVIERAKIVLKEEKEAIEALEELHDKVQKEWRSPTQRVLGHITRSPPITFSDGTDGFTEDYAIVELDHSKLKEAFVGNAIDLGTEIPRRKFVSMMYPRPDTPSRFTYPRDRLLRLQGIISEQLMRKPDIFDEANEPCLLVIKNGISSGVTIGRATGIFSYVREYFSNNTHQTSREWAIMPYDKKSPPFSAKGDSGSIIVDGFGRIGGLLTGGTGKTDSTDITYATPFFWLFPRIKENGYPNAHLCPDIA